MNYRSTEPTAGYDITQTPEHQPGVTFRGSPRLVEVTAKAVESREIVPSLLYEICVRFIDLDRQSFQTISDFCVGKADGFVDGGEETKLSRRSGLDDSNRAQWHYGYH